MARSHARLSVAVWADADHRALTVAGQWLYAYLLAHPKLTLVGTLDLRPRRWAGLAADADAELVDAAVAELELAGHLIVDRDSEEVLIRSFSRHDLSPTRWNRNLTLGFWRAWSAVESPLLQAHIVELVPDQLWQRLADAAPPAAARFPRSGRSQPESPARSEPDPAVWSEPPSPSPSPSHGRTVSVTDLGAEPSSGSSTGDELDPLAACRLVGERRHQVRLALGQVLAPKAHLEACIADAVASLLATAQELADRPEVLTTAQLANLIDPACSPPSPHPIVAADAARRARDAADAQIPTAEPAVVAAALAAARAKLAEGGVA